MKIGEYVRTTDGIIGKIENYDNGEYWIRHSKDDIWKCSEDFIIKHSKNIIDLIKLGDIVFTDDFNGYGFIHIYSTEMLEALKEDVKMEVKIKSILTKEQYEANCYKLEE